MPYLVLQTHCLANGLRITTNSISIITHLSNSVSIATHLTLHLTPVAQHNKLFANTNNKLNFTLATANLNTCKRKWIIVLHSIEGLLLMDKLSLPVTYLCLRYL